MADMIRYGTLFLLIIHAVSAILSNDILELNCTTDSYGSCLKIGSNCYEDTQSVSMPNCPSFVRRGHPSNLHYLLNDGVCSDCVGSKDVQYGQPQDLTIKMIPYNNANFIVKVTWRRLDQAPGYLIKIDLAGYRNEHSSNHHFGCFCVSDNGNSTHMSRSFYLNYSYYSVYSNCTHLRSLMFTVKTHVLAKVYAQRTVDWPTNCYNFSKESFDLHRICGPPTPDKPRNIRWTHELLSNSSFMSLSLNWDDPVDTHPEFPLRYYLSLIAFGSTNNIYYYPYLLIKNTTAITIEPLHVDSVCIFTLFPYQPSTCTFDRYCEHSYACGITTQWTVSHTIVSPSPTVELSSTDAVTELLTSFHITPSHISLSHPVSSNVDSEQPLTVVASVGGGMVVILMGTLIVVFILIAISCTKRAYRPRRTFIPSSLPSSLPPSPLSTRTPSPVSPPMSPTSIITTLSFSQHPYQAIFVESKATPDKDRRSIIYYLCYKECLGKYVTVGYYDKYSNITPGEWLQRMQDVPKILCVCNKWFYEEWNEQRGGTLVAALRVLVTSVLNSNPSILSSRFAVVLPEESDRQYIPEFLPVKDFMLTDSEGLAHYLTGVREYDLASVHSLTS